MKYLLPLFLLLLIAVPAISQEMVKVNGVEYYDKLTPPPADPQEAYVRAECKDVNGTIDCDPDKAYKPLNDQLTKIDNDLGKVLHTLAQAQMPSGQQMDAKEIKKKMKSMTKEERMQYAMQMSQSMAMNAAPIVQESPAVNAAMEEYNKLVQESAERVRNAGSEIKEKAKPAEKRQMQHAEIDRWTETETKKLPQISTGEMGGPEPKAYYALMTKSIEKHLTVEKEYLAAIRKQWFAERQDLKKLYTPYQQKLVAVHYGEDAKNAATKQSLVNGQAMIFKGVGALVNQSRDVTAEAAEWWTRKVMLEKTKPQ